MSSRPLGGWALPANCQPYAQDRVKQARFDAFVQDEARATQMCADAGLPPRDVHRELQEFDKVAAFFSRPKHSMISDRFTSSEVQGSSSTGSGLALRKDRQEEVPAEPAGPEHQVAAATMGMFGKLTRTMTDWQPEPLLCKRFNVPCPAVSKSSTARRPVAQSATFNDALLPIAQLTAPTATGGGHAGTRSDAQQQRQPQGQQQDDGDDRARADRFLASLQPVGHGMVDVPLGSESVASSGVGATSVALEEVVSEEVLPRPPMELFRAIFQDSSDEEAEEVEAAAGADQLSAHDSTESASREVAVAPPAALADAPAAFLPSSRGVYDAPMHAATSHEPPPATHDAMAVAASGVWADSGSSDVDSRAEDHAPQGKTDKKERKHRKEHKKEHKEHKKDKGKHKKDKKDKKHKRKRDERDG